MNTRGSRKASERKVSPTSSAALKRHQPASDRPRLMVLASTVRAHPYRPAATDSASSRPQSPIVPMCLAPSLRLQRSVQRFVLSDHPLPVSIHHSVVSLE